MKTKIIISVVALSLVLITKSVFAEERNTVGTPKTVRNQIREEVKTERQEIKTEISELKLKKIKISYDAIRLNLTKRHEAILKIKDKLDARVAKNPMNKNTDSAVAKLKEFDAAEAIYVKDLADLDAKFNEIISNSKPSRSTSSLKDATNNVRQDLNSMKKILKEAIVLLAQSPKLEVKETE